MNKTRDHWPFFTILLAFLLLPIGANPGRAQEMPIAQLILETASGAHEIIVEVAGNDAARAKGLMHRTELAPDHGMLFRFLRPRNITMWMKDTPLALDMVFIQPDGRVHRIAANTVPFSLDYIPAGALVSGVLELNAGTADRLGLKPGDHIRLKEK